MYRFLATPKWLGFAALMISMSAVMGGLGNWQLHRYHERHGINVRISQAKTIAPVPVTDVMTVGHPLPSNQEWVRVTATGTYVPQDTIVARERTVNSEIGFEIVTPLVLADGSAVLVDRGFLAGDTSGSNVLPQLPPVPSGIVTVSGRVHLAESEPDTPIRLSGRLAVRRITPSAVAKDLGFASLYHDYILLDQQTPKATGGFEKIPADTQPSWMNAGYTVQWWAFAGLALFGFGWAARREAHDRRDGIVRTPSGRRDVKDKSRDRVPEDRDPVSAMPPLVR